MFKQKKGFTLVELLVVVGIIALLIAILLPALQKARESAQRVACMSNQRQILLGIVMYAQEHDARMPPDDVSLPNPNNPSTTVAFQWFTQPFVGQYLHTTTDLPYYTSNPIFFCPTVARRASPSDPLLFGAYFGIGYNCHPDARLFKPDRGGRSELKYSAIEQPSQLIILSDVDMGTDPANKFYRWVQPYNGAGALLWSKYASEPSYEATSYRHDNKANVGFLDGHVDAFIAKSPDDLMMNTHKDDGLDAAIQLDQARYIAAVTQ